MLLRVERSALTSIRRQLAGGKRFYELTQSDQKLCHRAHTLRALRASLATALLVALGTYVETKAHEHLTNTAFDGHNLLNLSPSYLLTFKVISTAAVFSFIAGAFTAWLNTDSDTYTDYVLPIALSAVIVGAAGIGASNFALNHTEWPISKILMSSLILWAFVFPLAGVLIRELLAPRTYKRAERRFLDKLEASNAA